MKIAKFEIQIIFNQFYQSSFSSFNVFSVPHFQFLFVCLLPFH